MLMIQDVAYIHSNKDVLFSNLNLTISRHSKTALIGNNGSGKSTLLQLIAGELQPAAGQIIADATPYYVPQVYGQFDEMTVAEAIGVADKFNALQRILQGDITEEAYAMLDDDWTIEERCHEAFRYWQMDNISLLQKMQTLSGGQKTKVFLAGILVHEPELILLDEPSNHLDVQGRQLLYDLIENTRSTMLVVSHDRRLLNLPDTVCELDKEGIAVYGGNYEQYRLQKQIANEALQHDVQSKEKALRKAREKERETIERQQRLDARGKKKQEKAGVAKIMMNTLRNNAEQSTSKLKNVHSEKISGIASELKELRSALPDIDQMRFGFDSSSLHRGKILFMTSSMNFAYNGKMLWKEDLDITITSGERIALKGANGSGKTTLIQLVLEKLAPTKGSIQTADSRRIYIDQDYSLIDNQLSVYEQVLAYNTAALQEHELKNRLNRFLFTASYWDKPCQVLSGGEKMRLALCCLNIYSQSPEMIILDEPTNNLDIRNVEILIQAINSYEGTLIVVSHDEWFLAQLKMSREIILQ